MKKFTFKSNFALLFSFWLWFQRVINGMRSHKSYRLSIYTCMVYQVQVWKHEKFCWWLTGAKNMYFFGWKNKKCYLGWDTPPSTFSMNLVYMCAGVFRGHKSSTRIELSWFILMVYLLCFYWFGLPWLRVGDRWVGGYLGSPTLVYMSLRVFRGKESSNRMELSQLVQDLLIFYWSGGPP